MNSRMQADLPVPDLSWSDDGWFTQFLPNTKAGEDAWRVMTTHTDGTGKVFSVHAADTIRQLRAKGYTVAKARRADKRSGADDDALLAELAKPQAPRS
jgi:hypothetical protein